MNGIHAGNEIYARPSKATRATPYAPHPVVVHDTAAEIVIEADVLVIGGGLAGTWAAIAAAESGARVLLADKGYCGNSGVGAGASISHWLVPPDARDEEIAWRESKGGFLSDRDWMRAVLDEVWERTALLPEWGMADLRPDFVKILVGKVSPEERSFMSRPGSYLRFLRSRVLKVGARILDHSSALELLRDADGVISGAHGFQLQRGREWRVRAGAVILASGGTTWKSRSLGSDVLTGDGHLMAAEVGAHFSSMEHASWYSMAPAGTSLTTEIFYLMASHFDANGKPLLLPDGLANQRALWEAASRTRVSTQFTQFASREQQTMARSAMPHLFMVIDKLGVEPFAAPFPIDVVQDGTVRASGGVHVIDRDGSTGVPGLYAAGDLAARDRVVGFGSSGGGPNSAWAIASGNWAGRGAAGFSRDRHPVQAEHLEPTGTVGLRPRGRPGAIDQSQRLVATTQAEMLPIEKTVQFRSDSILRESLNALDTAWDQVCDSLGGEGADAVRARGTAAMLAMARWSRRAALERRESRGVFYRSDYPNPDPAQARRLLVGGLDEIWVRPDSESPVVGTPTREST